MDSEYRKRTTPLSINTETQRFQEQRKRKRLLSDILDALNELNDQDDEPDPSQSIVSYEDGFESLPAAQPEPQDAHQFFRFQRRINKLDKELESLAHTFRQLGSPGMVSSSFQLRTRISIVLGLFRKNAAKLFPKLLFKLEDPPELPWSIRWKLTLERFPEELEYLSSDLMIFLGDLNEFPELTHEPLKASVLGFTGDLEYWTLCLRDFKAQFGKDPAVQRYMHDLTDKMGEHLCGITNSISSFVEVIVPAIRVAKQQTSTTLLSLSGLATFVSAVTATGIQMSFDKTDTPLSTAVNAFWFSSLVFSVASAVNALLGLAWAQSPYRSPRNRVPWWISLWIRRSPLIFLVVALVAFSVGLVIFTWTSSQHPITCLMTTAFTGIGFLSLIIVSLWFVFERTTFVRHNGQRLLVDVISDLNIKWMRVPRYIKVACAWSRSQARRIQEAACSAVRTSLRSNCQRQQNSNNERTLPIFNHVVPAEPSMQQSHPPHFATFIPSRRTASLESMATASLSRQLSPEVEVIIGSQTHLPGNTRLAARSQSISVWQAMSLNMVEKTSVFVAHQDPVSHLQFSPDGKWLATSGHDKTTVLFKIGNEEPFIPDQILTHPLSVLRVAWAPRGGHLLSLQLFLINIWNKDGDCVNEMEQNPFVESAAWLRNGKEFLSLGFSSNGCDVKKMDLDGSVLMTHYLPRLDLHDLAVTPDEQYMIAVGNVIEPPNSPRSQEAEKETRIIVYKLATKFIECQVPVSQQFDNILMSRNGRYILVSHVGTSTMTLPQLWRLDQVGGVMRLSLCRTYTPSSEFNLPIRCCFGGRFDQLIICTGKGGHMDIWDRDSGTLLHDLQLSDEVTCIAWNTANDVPMLATGSTDGGISIWTLPESCGSMMAHPNPATSDDDEQTKEEEIE